MSDVASTAYRKAQNMIARAVVARTHDATDAGMQLTEVTLLRDEAKVAVERFQQYGFTSHVPDESEGIVVFVGGDRSHGILLSADNRATRLPGLGEGEVALYSAWGDFIALCADGKIDIHTKTLVIRAEVEIIIETPKLTIRAPEVQIEGNLVVTGNIVAGGGNVGFTGDLHVDGNIQATGNITAPGGHIGP